MKIASWNVNSLRVRLPQVLDWMADAQPDVLGLQETKLTDDQFPEKAIRDAGYHVVYSGQKTYNGVAIMSRSEPTDVVTDVPGLEDPQRRILAATIDGVRVLNLYVVNGQAVGSEKYDYKLHWLERVTEFVAAERERYDRMVVLGDFNIAPADADVHDPELWHERILCSTPEREALQRLMGLGFQDTYRLFDQPEGQYSWWDYRQAGFRRNRGLRIDLVLASQALAADCRRAWIDVEPRRWERPSDHAPAVAEFGAAEQSA